MKIKFDIILLSLVIGYSCKSPDPVPINEEELITTLIYELTPNDGGPVVTFRFQDLDGNGGMPPVITSDTLISEIVYTGRITVLNESTSPPLDITKEIEEEAEAHQFFYENEEVLLTIKYNDEDANGYPIGVLTHASSGLPGFGTLTITLRHDLDKMAENVADGDISNAGGDTDIQVTFDAVVK